MSYQLVIGNKNYSSWSLRPWLAMRLFDIPFEEVRIPLDTEKFEIEIAKYSKAKRVPVLLHDALTIWDSMAIFEYLAEQHPDKQMWPEQSSIRAHARAVCAEMHSGFSSLRGQMPMNCRATGRRVEMSRDTQKDVKRIHEIWQECRITHAENGPWLYGRVSLVDAMYAPVVSRFHTYGVGASDEITAYMQSVLGHQAMKEWYAAGAAESEVIEREETGIPASV